MNLRRRTLAFGLPAMLALPAAARPAGATPITEYERKTGGHAGVYAQNLRTGATFAWRADEFFIMCSTFKASLVACVLSRVDRGLEHLDALVAYSESDLAEVYSPIARANLAKRAMSVEAMCKAAVEVSDGACANLLLARIGGPPALTSFWRAAGDTVSRLDHREPFLDRSPSGGPADSTTPAAIAGTLKKLVLGDILAKPSRMRLTAWLIGCQTGGDRLRAGLPGNWVIADKTGHNGRDVAADIAIAWPRPDTPIVICAFTRGGAPTDMQFNDVFAGVGRLIAAQLA